MKTTIFTKGFVAVQKSASGGTHFLIDHSKSNGSLAQHVVDGDYTFETQGAVLESYGPHGRVLEVIGFDDFKQRFPLLLTPHMLAGGLCSLTGGGGNYSCSNTSCTGSCTLHNIPVYCSCD